MIKITKKLKSIPKFKDEKEEIEFWQKVDLTDYIYFSKAKVVNFFNLKLTFKDRSKYWNSMCNILDKCFPKGKCKERGKALVMLEHIELLLQGKLILKDLKGRKQVKKSK
jgi:hypothetical protein